MNSEEATFAIYRDREEIKVAIHSFLKLGFKKSNLWVFQSRPGGAKDFSLGRKYQFKNGAMIGAIVGAYLMGATFIMFAGKFFDGRATAMIFGVILGAIFGAVAGTLVGIGTPIPAAKRYGQYLQSGGILLSVHSETPKQIVQAQEILTATGGQDIQLINEIKTWDRANLERLDLEKLQTDVEADL